MIYKVKFVQWPGPKNKIIYYRGDEIDFKISSLAHTLYVSLYNYNPDDEFDEDEIFYIQVNLNSLKANSEIKFNHATYLKDKNVCYILELKITHDFKNFHVKGLEFSTI